MEQRSAIERNRSLDLETLMMVRSPDASLHAESTECEALASVAEPIDIRCYLSTPPGNIVQAIVCRFLCCLLARQEFPFRDQLILALRERQELGAQ